MYTIEKVTTENYPLFMDMTQRRRDGKEKRPFTPDAATLVQKVISDENFAVYAAKADEKFVGWISLINLPKISRFYGNGYIYVDELWVEEDWRRKGIATALLEKAEEMKEQLGAVGIRLYANTENPAAVKLYRKFGFTGNDTAFFMEK